MLISFRWKWSVSVVAGAHCRIIPISSVFTATFLKIDHMFYWVFKFFIGVYWIVSLLIGFSFLFDVVLPLLWLGLLYNCPCEGYVSQCSVVPKCLFYRLGVHVYHRYFCSTNCFNRFFKLVDYLAFARLDFCENSQKYVFETIKSLVKNHWDHVWLLFVKISECVFQV